MIKIIDTRGLSCPQPVILTLDEIQAQETGELVIIVDTDTSKENVSRAAESKGWKIIGIKSEAGDYHITIKKD